MARPPVGSTSLVTARVCRSGSVSCVRSRTSLRSSIGSEDEQNPTTRGSLRPYPDGWPLAVCIATVPWLLDQLGPQSMTRRRWSTSCSTWRTYERDAARTMPGDRRSGDPGRGLHQGGIAGQPPTRRKSRCRNPTLMGEWDEVRLKRVPGNLLGVGPATNTHSKQEHLDALDTALDVVTMRKVHVVTGAEVDSQ